MVLISHADFPTAGDSTFEYLRYDDLGRHLASHGYVVVSISRFALNLAENALEQYQAPEGGFLLGKSLDWLFLKSDYRNMVADSVAVIGHSAGGHIAITNLDEITSRKTLSAAVFFASSFSYDKLPQFSAHTKAVLLMGAAHGQDPVDGSRGNGMGKMQSVFGLYDQVGNESVSKTAIFFARKISQGVFDNHLFQNSPVALAYVAAFLGQHMKGEVAYGAFFSDGILPGSLQKPDYLLIQHHEPSAKLLEDFSAPYVGNIAQQVENVRFGNAWALNDWASPSKRVMTFEMLPGGFLAAPHRVRLMLSKPAWTAGYKRLAIRMGQIYDLEIGIGTGNPLEPSVSALWFSSSATKPIPFPINDPALTNPGLGDFRKTVLATYTVPLSAIGAEFTGLHTIELSFKRVTKKAALMIGDIELWK